MRIDVRALAIVSALGWGVGIFLVGLANLIWTGYAADFLRLVASIYPGYEARPELGQVIVGALYALVDGFLGGLILGWLYNLLAGRRRAAAG